MIEEDNAYVNEQNDQLREENQPLIIENEGLREKFALAERRREHAEAELARVTAFWKAIQIRYHAQQQDSSRHPRW
jgi:regulator of replication initiation timing